jgi:putative flavoprotein involved in K+ transport
MTLPARTHTVVVGAGQAGLAMSSFLTRGGRDHVVLDRRPSLGGDWQDRWDEFRLVTPNWTASFPGAPYEGPDPDGFMTRDEIAGRVARYASRIDAPVQLEVEVTQLSKPNDRFLVVTTQGGIAAEHVVVATGSYHVPRIPPIARGLPKRLEQIHSHDYRRESSLAPGAVLVVGTGQSGVQIAEELHEVGRQVYLSVGKAGRLPRRYRGRDAFAWLAALARNGAAVGVPFPTVDQLPDPRLKFAANPHVSGHAGGHDTNLREFAARGMTLLGRIERVDRGTLRLASDLSANLARADAFFGERFGPLIDRYIEAAGLDAPAHDRIPFAFDPPEVAEVDLDEAGISTVIWATGYGLDYHWIDLPVLDDLGHPKQRRGITEVPGLAFLGLHWQHTQASATLVGPLSDGPYLAAQLGLPVAPPERTAAAAG